MWLGDFILRRRDFMSFKKRKGVPFLFPIFAFGYLKKIYFWFILLSSIGIIGITTGQVKNHEITLSKVTGKCPRRSIIMEKMIQLRIAILFSRYSSIHKSFLS